MENYEKLYKEALERATKLAFTGNISAIAAGEIFHELRESEDEKIKKDIVKYLKSQGASKRWDFNTWIAWLEKQGERKTEIEYIYPKFRIGDAIEPIKPNGSYTPVRVLSVEKRTKSYYCESDDKKHFSSIPIRCEDEYKLVEQKPDDKAEPKFKVGDWIVYSRNDSSREILYVYDIRDGRYYFNDNVHFSWSVKECDEKSHLWTIQDAKDGDVLLSPSTPAGDKECPFIFKEIDENGVVRCHVALLQSENLKIDDGITNVMGYADAGYDIPATKKQRDLLFQKMKEAGYEWNAEKKELYPVGDTIQIVKR